MYTEEELIEKRQEMRRLMLEEEIRSTGELSQRVGMSKEWVKKWRKRCVDRKDNLRSRSRRPNLINTIITKELIEEVSRQRENRMEGRTIAYHLKKKEVKCSASTTYKILKERGYIAKKQPKYHIPFERPEAMRVWEIDYCDVPSLRKSEKKKQHAVEVLVLMDEGTSSCVDLQASDTYDAESTIHATADAFLKYGLPQRVVCDRDPRLVGSWTANGMPSAWMKMLLCLGVYPDVLRAHRPQDKPFVERYIRTLKSEILRPKAPENLAEVKELLAQEKERYNFKRSNQSKVCKDDHPPLLAFTDLPTLPRIPEEVDPDSWISQWKDHWFTRQVSSSGRIRISKHSYYVGIQYAKRKVLIKMDGETRTFHVEVDQIEIKVLPIKGLYAQKLDWTSFIQYMADEARSEWKDYLWRQRRKVQRID